MVSHIAGQTPARDGTRRILSTSAMGKVSTRQPSPGGLIFGLIRLRSSTFIGIRISEAMQVADVNGIWRTIIPTPENRKASRLSYC
jgi:hypothetical protein